MRPGIEQLEQSSLFAVIGACWIAEGRPDAAILFIDQLVVRHCVAKAPVLPRSRMKVFGERLRQPIGDRFDDDGGVVVVLCFELFDELVYAKARGDGKRANVISDAAVNRRDEVGERSIRLVVGDNFLLA